MTSSALDDHSAYILKPEKLIVAVEDEYDIWPIAAAVFESHSPLKNVTLNNKAKKQVEVDELPVQYVLSSDEVLRNRPPAQNSPRWFRHPYATLILVSCEDPEDYRQNVRPKLQRLVQGEWREWLIVHVIRSPVTDTSGRLARRVYARIEDHFRKDRCCKLDLSSLSMSASLSSSNSNIGSLFSAAMEPEGWVDIAGKLVECIRTTVDVRLQHYEEEVRRLWSVRDSEQWKFSSFFVDKESMALMMEMVQLKEEALLEYEEMEQCYLEVFREQHRSELDFGGSDPGDAKAALLDHCRKPFSDFVQAGNLRAFDFLQYLFARQAALRFDLGRVVDVARKATEFIAQFSRHLVSIEENVPPCFKEVWVYTACLSVAGACAHRFSSSAAGSHMDRDFHKLQAGLYSLARKKLLRIGDLVGYGSTLARSPCNRSGLTLNPWPKVRPSPPSPQQEADFHRLLEQKRELEKQLAASNLDASISWTPPTARYLPLGPLPSTADQLTMSASKSNALLSSPSPLISSEYCSIGSLLARGEQDLRHLAAMHLSLLSLSDDFDFHRALESLETFQDKVLEISRLAADSYVRCSWRRHGLSLDAEVASLLARRGSLAAAVKLYERLAVFYQAEGWPNLLLDLLPCLAHCHSLMGDIPAHLQSYSKLLALKPDQLQALQQGGQPNALLTIQHEINRLSALLWTADGASSPMVDAVNLELSSLLSFAPLSSPLPLEVSQGDEARLEVGIWSSFPEPVRLHSLSFSIGAPPSYYPVEGTKVECVEKSVTLSPGLNRVMFSILAGEESHSLDEEHSIEVQVQGVFLLRSLSAYWVPLPAAPSSSPPVPAVKVQSNTVTRNPGPPGCEDFFTSERQLKPTIKVSPSRHSAEMNAWVSWGLLLGHPQWVGIKLKPVNCSLQRATLTISCGPSIALPSPQRTLLHLLPPSASTPGQSPTPKRKPPPLQPASLKLPMVDGTVSLPSMAEDAAAVLWVKVTALPNSHAAWASSQILRDSSSAPAGRQTSAGDQEDSVLIPLRKSNSGVNPAVSHGTIAGKSTKAMTTRPSAAADVEQTVPSLESLRLLHVRLSHGSLTERTVERSIGVHFLDPFSVSTRLANRSSDGDLLLQVNLLSQLAADVTVCDAWLDLQPGIEHSQKAEKGRPSIRSLPLSIHSSTEASLLFSLRTLPGSHQSQSQSQPSSDISGGLTLSTEAGSSPLSCLHVEYSCQGSPWTGAHSPSSQPDSMADETREEVKEGNRGSSSSNNSSACVFKHSFELHVPHQRHRVIAVGMLPLPAMAATLCVGSMLPLQWRVERLVAGRVEYRGSLSADGSSNGEEMIEYEVKVNSDEWMVSGRTKGFLSLSASKGSRAVLALPCIPITAGFLHPPMLHLPALHRSLLSHSPAGPHIICVAPSMPTSALCVSRRA